VTDGDDIISYLIKPNWADVSDVISTWKGIERENAISSSAGGEYLTAPYPLGANLLVISKNSESSSVLIYDKNLQIISSLELKLNDYNYRDDDIKISKSADMKRIILIIKNSLFYLKLLNNNELNGSLTDDNALSASFIGGNGDYEYVYIKNEESSCRVVFVDFSGKMTDAARIPYSESFKILPVNQKVFVLAGSASNAQTLTELIDPVQGIECYSWIPAGSRRIEIANDSTIYYLKYFNGKYLLVKKINGRIDETTYLLPEGFIEPYCLKIINGAVFIIFRNGLVTTDLKGTAISANFFPFGEKFTTPPDMSLIADRLILSGSIGANILKRNDNKFWLINRFFLTSGKIIIPAILFLIAIIFLQLYRHEKRLLRTLFELPSAGVVFFIDKSGRLSLTNDFGKKFLGISGRMPMNRNFSFYCTQEHIEPLQELVESALTVKETINQKINIIGGNEIRELYCNIVPIRNIAGNYRGILLTGIDITEQLEKRKLSNWAQLAHDMQTNLTTIRLNAEMMEFQSDDANKERRNKIIFQVNLLIQRVRDIVTVGRSDKLDKKPVPSEEICNEVKNEFDPVMYPNVEFSFETEQFNILCDKPKLIRAIRNSVENAVRALPDKQGQVSIKCRSESNYVYIMIKDSGIGMDENTKAKMLKPFFSTSKKDGGLGIGTMIMQQVIELHGGEIKISSEKGSGAEITFILPNFPQVKKGGVLKKNKID
ncbi:MAG: sensor histidine kinase, partial [Bacteroidota bacterium]|nr:sensor histidine kinase [Bacteroidota bacterium]